MTALRRFLRPVRNVMAKDGRELLRDRRTLFVNVVLPVLLYPLLGLLFIQVHQIARFSDQQVAIVGIYGDTTPVDACTDILNENDRIVVDHNGPADLGRRLAGADPLAGHEIDHDDLMTTGLIDTLRRANWAAALFVSSDGNDGIRMTLAIDRAGALAETVEEAFHDTVERLSQQRLEARLEAHGLDPDILVPVHHTWLDITPTGDLVRRHLAGLIPFMLIMLVVGGAFFPALDAIAGERERGTLETQLSWPITRGQLFVGKLLVVIIASMVTVLLNLLSLTATALILLAVAPDGAAVLHTLVLGSSFGFGLIILVLATLVPLTVMIAAVALALAGLAGSFKEAQTYLSPLMLVVFVLAALGMIPDLRPNWFLDLLPILGPLLALRSALENPGSGLHHVILANAASIASTAVLVSWAARLFTHERFLYPGLGGTGWGRWRRWGSRPAVPGGLEAMALCAVSVFGFVFFSALGSNLAIVTRLTLPLLAGIALPALVHNWLGAYDPARNLSWRRPVAPRLWWQALLLLVPCLIMAINIGWLQQQLMPSPDGQDSGEMMDLMRRLYEQGGLPLLLLCFAVVPGVCEELLCRGPLLSGLKRSLGPVAAVLISAFLFAALHGSPQRFFAQGALGIVLAVLVLRSGSIFPAMILHALYNGTLVVVMSIALQHGLLDGDGEDIIPDPTLWMSWLRLLLSLLLITLILGRCRPPRLRPVAGEVDSSRAPEDVVPQAPAGFA